MRSMTGYARSTKDTKLGLCSIEIHSVNRKGLDLSIHLPKPLLWLDTEIRRWITSVLQRGQVTVRVHLKINEKNVWENEFPLLQTLQKGWRGLAEKLGYGPEEVTLSFLVKQKETLEVSYEIEPSFAVEMKGVMTAALEQLLHMKKEEGETLKRDFSTRLSWIKQQIPFLLERSSTSTLRFQEKLKERLKDFSSGAEIDERIMREVAILSEKTDITEELTRLSSHLDQFFDYMNQKESTVGKTLDFLAQEMQRELNTISAKCSDQDSIYRVLALKAELEKIREQVQNIE